MHLEPCSTKELLRFQRNETDVKSRVLWPLTITSTSVYEWLRWNPDERRDFLTGFHFQLGWGLRIKGLSLLPFAFKQDAVVFLHRNEWIKFSQGVSEIWLSQEWENEGLGPWLSLAHRHKNSQCAARHQQTQTCKCVIKTEVSVVGLQGRPSLSRTHLVHPNW